MIPKRIWLFLTLLFVLTACSSRVPNGAVVPEEIGRSGSLALNPATSCAIIPSSVAVGLDAFGPNVAGISATDAWAVGLSDFTFHHFNGTVWQLTAPPVIPNRSSYPFLYLNFVTPIASNDVWVGGEGVTASGNSTIFFLHWNGSAWKYVPSDPSLTQDYTIQSMAGDVSNDVWAVVESAAASTIDFERWNGTRWSHVVSQAGSPGLQVYNSGLVVFGLNDVSATMSITGLGIAIAHWNGTRVGETLLPHVANFGPYAGNLGGTSNNDLWVTAFLQDAANSPYIQHRSSSWGPYDTSLVKGYLLQGVVDFRPGYVLTLANDATGTPALLVYNGYVRWRPTTSPWPVGASGVTTGQIVKGTTSFWAAFGIPDISEVALVHCPSTPPAPL